MLRTVSRRNLVALCVALTAVGVFSGANTGPITRLTVAKDAEIVSLFDGIASGQFQARLVADDANKSLVFITNTTANTLNVALPKAAVGVHVLPQFNFNGGLLGPNTTFPNNQFANNGIFGNPNQNLAAAAGGNTAQGVGGKFQPGGVLNTLQNAQPQQGPIGIGNGFPSVPPEWAARLDVNQYGGFAAVPANKTIQLQMRTVCLNYGRPDPLPSLPYRLVNVEQYSSDPALAELLENYSPRVNQQVMQAAAWHVANGLSWDRLAQLPDHNLPGTSAKLFTLREVQTARQLVLGVAEQATKRPKASQSSGVSGQSSQRREVSLPATDQ